MEFDISASLACFKVFSSYLHLEKVHISFDEFLKDISPIRAPMALIFSLMIQFIALNPEPVSFNTMRDMQTFQETYNRQVGSVPSETDDPMVKEMRRRMIGVMQELDNEGLL